MGSAVAYLVRNDGGHVSGQLRFSLPIDVSKPLTSDVITTKIALSRSDDPPSSKSALGRWAPHVEGKMVDGELWSESAFDHSIPDSRLAYSVVGPLS